MQTSLDTAAAAATAARSFSPLHRDEGLRCQSPGAAMTLRRKVKMKKSGKRGERARKQDPGRCSKYGWAVLLLGTASIAWICHSRKAWLIPYSSVFRGSSSREDEAGGDGAGSSADVTRVAVCFFGVTRSLRWTLPSVQKRLFGVLERGGMAVDVFVHTYALVEMNNDRAGENGVDYEAFINDFEALQPTRSLVTNQDDFDLIWPDPMSLTHYNWVYSRQEAPGVISNIFRAYWSMSLVWGLMAEYAREKRFEYDAVVLARPDVWFHYNVDLPSQTFPLPKGTVFIPSFDAPDLANTRRNDRFAYGSVSAMRVAMNRLATLLESDAGKHRGDIDSEWVFGHHLLTNNISVRMLDLLVSRVRLTREIPLYDHRLVTEACQSGDDPMACEMVEAGLKFPEHMGAQ